MARYKQTFGNSCGAVALMCAATELNVSVLPSAGKWSFLESSTPLKGNTAEVGKALLSWNGQTIPGGIANGGNMVEKAIYAVTSGDMKDYSMPSRIVACAKHLGLNVSIYMAPGFYSVALNFLYKDEIKACEAQGVTITRSQSPGPAGNQRELVVLSTVGVGLHYVLRRPVPTTTNAYMDPGDGTDYSNFGSMNKGMKLYRETGISIMLSA